MLLVFSCFDVARALYNVEGQLLLLHSQPVQTGLHPMLSSVHC